GRGCVRPPGGGGGAGGRWGGAPAVGGPASDRDGAAVDRGADRRRSCPRRRSRQPGRATRGASRRRPGAGRDHRRQRAAVGPGGEGDRLPLGRAVSYRRLGRGGTAVGAPVPPRGRPGGPAGLSGRPGAPVARPMSEAPTLERLASDLSIETEWLRAVLGGLGDAGWDRATPAPGWSVRDQITHLAYFDEATTMAATDPDRFRQHRQEVLADIDAFTTAVAAANRHRPGTEILAWFDRARATMLAAITRLDPRGRAPWYGPDMSVMPLLTARIMETWAHGQDVADALGVEHVVTPALRQVAHIGVQTRANSFRARGRPVPEADVRVVLRGPDGDEWTWG